MYRFFVTARAKPPGNQPLVATATLRSVQHPQVGLTFEIAQGVRARVIDVSPITLDTLVEVTPTELDYLLSIGWDARPLVC